MITLQKLKEFEQYEGRDDLYQLEDKFDEGIISSSEWTLITDLMGEVRLILNNLASEEYSKRIIEKLNRSCDGNGVVIEYFIKIANQNWI